MWKTALHAHRNGHLNGRVCAKSFSWTHYSTDFIVRHGMFPDFPLVKEIRKLLKKNHALLWFFFRFVILPETVLCDKRTFLAEVQYLLCALIS